MTYRCPECHESDTLYEEVMVPGRRSVDENLNQTGSSHSDRDVEWSDAECWGNYGCSCGWGPKVIDYLEVLGVDGEPLPSVHRNQLALPTEATPSV